MRSEKSAIDRLLERLLEREHFPLCIDQGIGMANYIRCPVEF